MNHSDGRHFVIISVERTRFRAWAGQVMCVVLLLCGMASGAVAAQQSEPASIQGDTTEPVAARDQPVAKATGWTAVIKQNWKMILTIAVTIAVLVRSEEHTSELQSR